MVTLTDVTEDAHQYGEGRYADGAKSRDEEIVAAFQLLKSEQAAREADKTALAAALKRIKELESTGPVQRLPFGVGITEKATSAASPLPYTRAALEKDAGVLFGYVHEYFTFSATVVTTSAVTWAEGHLKAGRIPILTFKLPGGDWKGTALGKYDAAIDATMDALAALQDTYGLRLVVAVHHEPNNGDGAKADFDAMTTHLSPIVRRPGVIEFWVNLTGWSQLYGPDNDWRLDDLLTDGIDGYAFNPYLSLGASSTKFTDMVAAYAVPFGEWAAKHGLQWGIWETGLNAVAAASKLVGVKTWWTAFTDGCAEHGATMVIWWNNKVAPSAAKPTTSDWRITAIAPADTHSQMVASMKKWALAA